MNEDGAATAAERPLRIGELAAELGIPAKTIRYYEQIGLLPAARRAPSGYRLYDDADRRRLRFVVKAKALGLSLDEIREILARRQPGQDPCAYVIAVLDRKVVALHDAVRALLGLRRELAAVRQAAASRRGAAAEVCAIIERHEPTPRAQRGPLATSSLERARRPR